MNAAFIFAILHLIMFSHCFIVFIQYIYVTLDNIQKGHELVSRTVHLSDKISPHFSPLYRKPYLKIKLEKLVVVCLLCLYLSVN